MTAGNNREPANTSMVDDAILTPVWLGFQWLTAPLLTDVNEVCVHVKRNSCTLSSLASPEGLDGEDRAA